MVVVISTPTQCVGIACPHALYQSPEMVHCPDRTLEGSSIRSYSFKETNVGLSHECRLVFVGRANTIGEATKRKPETFLRKRLSDVS